jgi:hypothetical protein
MQVSNVAESQRVWRESNLMLSELPELKRAGERPGGIVHRSPAGLCRDQREPLPIGPFDEGVQLCRERVQVVTSKEVL